MYNMTSKTQNVGEGVKSKDLLECVWTEIVINLKQVYINIYESYGKHKSKTCNRYKKERKKERKKETTKENYQTTIRQVCPFLSFLLNIVLDDLIQ